MKLGPMGYDPILDVTNRYYSYLLNHVLFIIHGNLRLLF